MSRFIVMEASAATPASWKWSGGPRGYRKIAVVETDGTRPKMISPRARGMVRIVRIWDRLYQGKTDRSEYHRALREAQELACELNGVRVMDARPGESITAFIRRADRMKKPPDKPAA